MTARTQGERSLTDADVAAIVDGLEKRIESRFYLNIGKGIWGVAWKVLLTLLLAIAAYGAMHSGRAL